VSIARQYRAENKGVKRCPFGMMMEERSYTATVKGYRFGFNGQEGDDEVSGEGNSWNYKYRMYDARLGRFFAVDPLAHDYPYYTPYSFAANQPIHAVELEGLESSNDLSPAQPSENKVYNDITFEFLDFLDPMLEWLDEHWYDEDKPFVDVTLASVGSENAGQLSAKACIRTEEKTTTTYKMSQVNDYPSLFIDPETGNVSGIIETDLVYDVSLRFSIESSQIIEGAKVSENVVSSTSFITGETKIIATTAMGLPSFGLADKLLQNKTTYNVTTNQLDTRFGLQISTPTLLPAQRQFGFGLTFTNLD
jgi:RHS repeat-associated protein